MKHFILFFVSVVVLLLTANLFAQWEPDVRLTYDDSTSYTYMDYAWCITADGNIVHAVWYDGRDGNSEIYYKRSPDGGTSWGPDTRLSDFPDESLHPSIAVTGSNVHVVWHDYREGNWEIYYKRSTDGGISWGSDFQLTYNDSVSSMTSVAVFGSIVHVVWLDHRDGNGEIYYKRSPDGGVSWGTDTRLSDFPSESHKPSVAVSDSNVHVVWHDHRNGYYEIYYKRSTDGGMTWEMDSRLSYTSSSSLYPSVGVSISNVHVIWIDYRHGNIEIYYRRSPDGGISWGAETRLTDNPADRGLSSIAVSGSFIHVVWKDNRDGNSEIYYKNSIDGGTSWGTDTRLTDNSANSANTSVAVSGSSVHVIWHDDRDGNNEIYYKRNPTGNIGVKEIENPKLENRNLILKVNPNPFTSVTRVQLLGANEEKEVTLEIFDTSGRLTQSIPLSSKTLLLGTDLNTGIYFLKLNGKPVGKVVKVR